MTEAELRRIQDRAEIEQLMHLFAEMVDRREWALMDRIFALEATIDFTTGEGIAGPFREALAWLDRALEPWATNLHFISNLLIDFEGDDEARASCYFRSPVARRNADGTQQTVTTSGVYRDRLLRTSDGWRIVERVCEQLLMEGSLPEGYHIPS